MHRSLTAPTRMRRRLAVAFALVAGILTGVLALTSFLIVRDARLRDSLNRGEREARFALQRAANLGPRADLPQFMEGFAERGIPAVLLEDGRRFLSDPALAPAIPSAVRDLAERGQLAYDRIEVEDRPFLVVGGRPPGTRAELYVLVSEQTLRDDLAELRNVLLGGWLAVLAVAGLVGVVVARRTLAPVAEAGRAAHALAEGLLDTRLPVQTADEFGAWAASFNEMADALEGKIRELSEAEARERRFTSDVSHELRTPLTALVSEASILAEHLERIPAEARRPAELLVSDVARLRRLVEDLMEISRLEAGTEVVRLERVDLAALVQATLRARGWADRVRVRGGSLEVISDRRRLERIVSNLVGNAVEHGGAEVEVEVGPDARGVFVSVSDRGPGIRAEDGPRLFDRFFKGDPSRSGGGSGLGLPIALENARLLGGDIEVASHLGAGARFTLRLPSPSSDEGAGIRDRTVTRR